MSARFRSLLYYLLTRLVLAPLLLWAIASLVFVLMRATPGDPVDGILGAKAPLVVKNALRIKLGLAGSWGEQYLRYMGDLLHGNLGESLTSSGTKVTEIIGNFFPATVELAFYSMAIALIVGVSIGAIAALKPNTGWDLFGRLFGIITYSLPLFWMGMVLQLILSVQLGWFPIGTRFPATMTPPEFITGLFTVDSLLKGDIDSFFTSLHYLCLPALSLGVVISGIFERIVRVNLKDTLRSDYVEAAIARGVNSRSVLINHALKNALIPVITVMGLTFASLLGGAVLTEVTFSYPGLANRLFQALVARDYPVVQGVVIMFALIVVIVSIAIDLINAWIDPRIRY
ncbi:ABC-type dipeptide/oligopeptide/nickel transport system, permease component [Synechococcus sp. PCC 7502]|uniref:ABC transporter permease n=1 Tax=Synechococcus sp. PCC 7502 TaxID=1173263 RepID=UPI00029F9C53|nr:ABC transporter permease [Synechococcus sp. PCC 7502]AFY72600.1 ABC-type dipeptide/oligopeptide/nickel transport system, permease component [Synechococcus sp. PCC 7502]